MTTMHNLQIKITNKVEYWEEMERTGNSKGKEPMDAEYNISPENALDSRDSTEKTSEKQNKQKHPHQPEAQEEATKKINRRQEKLENKMIKMMEILGNIAGKFNILG